MFMAWNRIFENSSKLFRKFQEVKNVIFIKQICFAKIIIPSVALKTVIKYVQ